MTALVPAAEKSKMLMQRLRSMEKSLAQVLPPDLRPEKVVMVAYTSVQRNPSLLESSYESVLGSVMSAAQLGLTVDPVAGQAYLVPFKVKGQMVCQLVVGYRGLRDLAFRSKMVRDLTAEVVREHDTFSFELGSHSDITHKITKKFSQRGEVTHVYSVIHLTTGGVKMEVMDFEQVELVRQRAPSGNSGFSPWKSDWDEMGKKTVLRRALKHVPASGERESMMLRAANVDELHDSGIDVPFDPEVQRAVDEAMTAPVVARPPDEVVNAKAVEYVALFRDAKDKAAYRVATERLYSEHEDVKGHRDIIAAKDNASARVHGVG